MKAAVPSSAVPSSSESPQAWWNLSIDALHESPSNPRRHYDARTLKELADSIRIRGILQPIVVRKHPKKEDHYEIVAGSRRYRAAKLAGLSTIPGVIRKLSDVDVLEIQVIENGQRDDVHPLEEAAGFGRLMELGPYTAEQIAEKVSHDATYVYRRLALRKLAPEAVKLFETAKIHLAHAQILARMEPRDQQTAIAGHVFGSEGFEDAASGKWLRKQVLMPARHLEGWYTREVLRDLGSVPWKLDDAELDKKAGACSVCPKRTSAQSQLFDDGAKRDRCMDSHCYQGKREGFLLREIERHSKPVVGINADLAPLRVASEYIGSTDRANMKKELLPQFEQHQFRKVGSRKECEHIRQAIVVHGENFGAILQVCAEPKCKKHFGGLGRSATTASERERIRKRNPELEIRRLAHASLIETLGQKVSGIRSQEVDVLLSVWLERRMGHDDTRFFCKDVLGLVSTKKESERDYRAEIKAHIAAQPVAERGAFLFMSILAECPPLYSNEKWTQALKYSALKYRLDLKKIYDAVAAPILAKAKAKKAAKKGGAK